MCVAPGVLAEQMNAETVSTAAVPHGGSLPATASEASLSTVKGPVVAAAASSMLRLYSQPLAAASKTAMISIDGDGIDAGASLPLMLDAPLTSHRSKVR